ncbi:alpha-ketoglutarate-dependent dioxygenase AlkB [Oceanospirillum sediminis]|uniref:Alpha-ketoglutarate-dependent dioxygenase AlkB n=1 Tax=Oceanospirillum sediminis TaxID=2760088 RepID=A0A839IRJ2_9GAMM|nr:alpha-ketoglutarate-dependent dioxygenase AlkB [Oceanospirillum sediminis]MBB1487057.1 alpha-ketoglutarate-dependent dioxygenase AlkB [Oceanospirillum sediminis]
MTIDNVVGTIEVWLGFMTADLFSSTQNEGCAEYFSEYTCLFRGGLLSRMDDIISELENLLLSEPFRRVVTPAGNLMSVSMSSCGAWGWTSDHAGYRYVSISPATGMPWPDMPVTFYQLAVYFAGQAGYHDFKPDSCLINCYRPGSIMGLHQDKDEADLSAPVVSFSLGPGAEFMWGGTERSMPWHTIHLYHGDVLVWGGKDRLRFHGVRRVLPEWNPWTGDCRINLTFRKTEQSNL